MLWRRSRLSVSSFVVGVGVEVGAEGGPRTVQWLGVGVVQGRILCRWQLLMGQP